MVEHQKYFEYLKTRSKLGLVYRKYWLYPRLVKNLKAKTLDIGCGIGDFVSYRKNTFGIDINKNNVNWCKENGLPVALMEIDKIPYSDASFNSIVIDNVLEHIKNPIPMLNEAKRVLTENGILVVGVPGAYAYTTDDDHKIFYSQLNLIKTLENNGFTKKKIFMMPFKSKILDKYTRQYCLYGVFIKN